MTLSAYYGDPALKELAMSRVAKHEAADQIGQNEYYGIYEGVFRACCVGCVAETSCQPHKVLLDLFGLPTVLTQLADVIHEGLTEAECKGWPRRFYGAIEPGADLSRVHHQFLAWLLRNAVQFDRDACPEVATVCERVAALHDRAAAGDQPAEKEWDSAYSAASAAYSAGCSAACSASELAACSVAESSAYWAACSSAESAAAWARMADKLEQLLKDATP